MLGPLGLWMPRCLERDRRFFFFFFAFPGLRESKDSPPLSAIRSTELGLGKALCLCVAIAPLFCGFDELLILMSQEPTTKPSAVEALPQQKEFEQQFPLTSRMHLYLAHEANVSVRACAWCARVRADVLIEVNEVTPSTFRLSQEVIDVPGQLHMEMLAQVRDMEIGRLTDLGMQRSLSEAGGKCGPASARLQRLFARICVLPESKRHVDKTR